jgi:hypothetical protein
MKHNDHVRANLEVVQKPLLSREEFFLALAPFRRTEFIDEEMEF